MDSPRVTFVMAVYNTTRTVGAAVESVLGQEFGDLELVVIDDGSTDGTAEVVRGGAMSGCESDLE